jgi:hypothetical protein
MKKWTVMLIPQGEGSTSTLTLSDFHFLERLRFHNLFIFYSSVFLSAKPRDV